MIDKYFLLSYSSRRNFWRYTYVALLWALIGCIEVPEEEKVVPSPPPIAVPPPAVRGLYENITLDQSTFYDHVKEQLPTVLSSNPDPSVEYEIAPDEPVISEALDIRHTPVADANFDGGDGSPDNPYLMSTLEQLSYIYTHRQAHYALIQDIIVETAESLEALGTSINEPFVGVFDGRGNSIIGLTITTPAIDNGQYGLFQSVGVYLRAKDSKELVTFGTIKNLILRNTTMSIPGRAMEGSDMGLLIGNLQGIAINCHIIDGEIRGGTAGATHSVGGLVGRAGPGSQVVFCSSSALVTAEGTNGTGGLVGNAEGGLISYSFATESVTGETNVGGLVGILSYKLWDCFASNSVFCETEIVGGLVGNVQGGALIENVYTSGENVTGTENVGGLIGLWNSTSVYVHRRQPTLIRNAYSIVRPSSNNGLNVGGILGLNQNPDHNDPENRWEIQNVYWNTDVIAVFGMLGREDGKGGVPFGRTTTEINCPSQVDMNPCTSRRIYTTWSDQSWDFGETNQRPLLRFENVRQTSRIF